VSETWFSFDLPPFDRLTPSQREEVLAGLDLGFYPRDSVIIGGGEVADVLHVVIMGTVVERHGADLVAQYGPHDSFDLKALFDSADTHTFLAAEDTLCHLLPRALVFDLGRRNPPFGTLLARDFADRLRSLVHGHSHREMAALTMARIGATCVRPPVFVEATASLRETAVAMKQHRVNGVLVRDGERVGIVTGTDLREAAILGDLPPTAPVGPLAHFELVTLSPDDPLFDAMILMVKHAVRRIVIRAPVLPAVAAPGETTEPAASAAAGPIVGTLEQIDLLGFLSNHSQVIALKVEHAASPDDLVQASRDVHDLIGTLHSTGVKTRYIAEMVTELNRRLFRRLFELLAPPELVADSCLMVMGSEGRAEQILKTDQDNGLIVRDGVSHPGLEELLQRFSENLMACGYPPCPGKVMVSNPAWAKPLGAFEDSIRQWVRQPDEQALMDLAIFYDAVAVAGDPALLAVAKRALLERIGDNDRFLAHFARPAVSFDSPGGSFLGGLFGERAGRQGIDLKKAAIFPLVHGVRSLALEQRLSRTNTLERLWALSDAKVLDRPFASALAETFAFLQGLRLSVRLGGGDSAVLRADSLPKAERDQLGDALDVVKRFKEFITYHFHLQIF